jgi:hypothetical protein
MFIINFCLNMFRASLCHLQENKGPVTAFGVLFCFCWMWLVAVVGLCVVGVHREQSMKREDQQDATIRCLLLTSVSTCFVHHFAHLQENKGRYQPHPAEPEQHTKCSNRAFVLLKMGIMMRETC